MMTIVTHAHLKEGAARDWDAIMRRRLSAATQRPGWIGGQLLRSADKPDRRVIVGTWKSRRDWEGWHHDPQFTDTRRQLDALENAPCEHWWHEVVLDVRKASTPAPSLSKSVSRAKVKHKTRRPRRRSA
jgi:heme-degrading monooxygenase HmoA